MFRKYSITSRGKTSENEEMMSKLLNLLVIGGLNLSRGFLVNKLFAIVYQAGKLAFTNNYVTCSSLLLAAK